MLHGEGPFPDSIKNKLAEVIAAEFASEGKTLSVSTGFPDSKKFVIDGVRPHPYEDTYFTEVLASSLSAFKAYNSETVQHVD